MKKTAIVLCIFGVLFGMLAFQAGKTAGANLIDEEQAIYTQRNTAAIQKRLLKKLPIGEEQAARIAEILDGLGIAGPMLISIDLEDEWGYAVKLIAGWQSYFLTMNGDGYGLTVRKGDVHGEVLHAGFLDTILF